MSTINRILVCSGDPYGVGPEVICKSLQELSDFNHAIIVIGPAQAFKQLKSLPLFRQHISSVKEANEKGLYLINTSTIDTNLAYDKAKMGTCNKDGGHFAKLAIDVALKACNISEASAMVTAPISKEAMQLTGFDILGHTEYLASETNTPHVVMALVKGPLRVALQSIHIPLKDVPSYVNEPLLSINASILIEALLNQFNITNPKIAILGLNPHAGENGHIGAEELDVINPFIQNYSHPKATIEGSFAADGFFGSGAYKNYDAILAMYHDQGLVGFKSLAFGGGVNTTLGLPFVRTSPDHGTAYAIAGKNVANPSSMLEAIQLAQLLVS